MSNNNPVPDPKCECTLFSPVNTVNNSLQTGHLSKMGGHASCVMTAESTHLAKLHGMKIVHSIRPLLKKVLNACMRGLKSLILTNRALRICHRSWGWLIVAPIICYCHCLLEAEFI